MASKSYPRAKRVGQQIQRALSELIRRELRDPRLGMITLTDVRMSPDLGYAKVYYSVLGADPHLAQEILTQAAEFLRGPLGRALGIRHSPELRFVQDELIESGARLSALINEAVKKDVATHVDDDAAAAAERASRAGEDHDGDDADHDDEDAHYNSDEDDVDEGRDDSDEDDADEDRDDSDEDDSDDHYDSDEDDVDSEQDDDDEDSSSRPRR